MLNPRTRKFLSYYRPYLRLFLTLMICALVAAGIALVFPLCIRYITKTVLADGLPNALGQIYGMGAVLVGLALIQLACNFFVDYRGHAMGAMMESDLRAELFEHLQKLPFSFYDEEKTGQLMSRITNDLLNMAEMYHHGPEDLVIYTIKFIGSFVILLTVNARLTLVVFLFIPVIAVFSAYFNARTNQALKRNKERVGDINAQVEDTLAGIRVVKSFANEAVETRKFAHENARFLESRKEAYYMEAFFFQGVQTLTQLMTVAVIVFGGVSITHAALDLADLITFLLYVNNLVEPIQAFLHMAVQYQEGVTGFDRFMEIMEIAPEELAAPEDLASAPEELAAPEEQASAPVNLAQEVLTEPVHLTQVNLGDFQHDPNALDWPLVRGEIEFRDVGFRYREDHAHVLRHIHLTAQAGDYIALVGSSGVGKTTLCSLIPRFYEVTEGAIYLDGVNIKDIPLPALRRSVGVVQQDVYLFAGTVAENIRYGKPGASEAEVIAAAQRANAHDFILSLPDGYQTDIGQRGVKLSGGQKQRLSIARVFLKDPPVLIFDEATSSLDNESEKVVQESLETLARQRTTFVIAHRLSTIRNAHRILVLTEQGIGEQGTHAELLALDGVYARLYQMNVEAG